MARLTLMQSISDALRLAMREDDCVVVLGEDLTEEGVSLFGVTDGFLEEFGAGRCVATPSAEAGAIGIAVGMSLYGLRPVVQVGFLDFLTGGFDQLVNEAAKMRYRSAGAFTCPMVVRAPYGAGVRGGHYHSQSTEAYFAHTPGLKVVVPSNPHDAKGLLLASIRDPDPVVFLEPKRLYRSALGEVPAAWYEVPLGRARVVREGQDVTVVAWGAMTEVAMAAAESAHEQWEHDCEVLDLRALVPLDKKTLLGSVRKTGRVVIVHEAPRTAGFGAEVSAIVAEEAVEYLEAPVARVCGLDTPVPYALEDEYLPSPERVALRIDRVMSF